MNAAVLRIGSSQPKAVALEQAYKTWAAHYEKCQTCNKQDWYDPIVEWLCSYGLGVFRGWDRAAGATGISTTPQKG